MRVLTNPSLSHTLNYLIAQNQSVFNRGSIDISTTMQTQVDVFIGYAQDFKKLSFDPDYKVLVVSKTESMTVQDYQGMAPSHVVTDSDVKSWLVPIAEIYSKLEKEHQKILIKQETEKKRSELESLNQFLADQDAERTTALKIFMSEEQLKKQEEKNLLYFLDFINTHYSSDDFIENFIKYLTTETKKITNYHHFGLIFLTKENSSADWITQDQRSGYLRKEIASFKSNQIDAVYLSQVLADHLKRPVGKILFWENENQFERFFLYFELLGQDFNQSKLNAYVSQRLNIIGLTLSRKLVEESEFELLKNWRQTFKAYRDPIHVIDRNFNVVQANYEFDSKKKTKCFQLLANRDAICEHCPIPQLKTKETKSMVEINQKTYQVSAREFKLNADSVDSYFVLFYEDRTEFNLLKTELLQSEKLNTIGNLANHLSHELNNPLTGLKMMTEMMIEDVQSTPSLQSDQNLGSDLKEIHKAIIRSENIIKDLADFSSTENKEMVPLVFNLLLQKTLVLLKTVTRKVRIFVDIKDRQINANANYLQQVVFNLIKNACEAMDHVGTIKIYEVLSLKTIDYIIEDTGPGFKQPSEIFKPFYTTKKEGEGTGLGLYLSAELMKRMNAELLLDETYSEGARFILRFQL